MDVNKKCNKYESFFIFQGEEVLLNHIKNCADCKEEHEKYRKISSLLKEAAPVYFKKQQKKNLLIKKLACCFIVLIGLTSFTGYKIYQENSFNVTYYEDSYITSMGLPVDEYGLFEL